MPKSSTLTVPSGLQLDVRGFQIAMHDASLVRGFERGGDLHARRASASLGGSAALPDALGERRRRRRAP